MEGFLTTFPPYSLCGPQLCGPPAPGSGGSWGKRDGRFMTPQGLNYLELCKAILSQMSPAPLRKANTKECGVQVNARVDKVVQCSLGPKTLFGGGGEGGGESPASDPPAASLSPQSPAPCVRPGGQTQTPGSHLRFLRPVSIYSPVFDRRVSAKKVGEDGGREGEAEAAEPEVFDGEDEADHCGEEDTERESSFRQSAKGSNFQFLEQRYGFFHCKKCNIRWESAYVWCISGTSKVYYKQLCRKCQVGFNPYRVEAILCKGCSQTCCSCEKKQRHINMKRPHRQDLCCRCKGMRLSCDATYSFKYIV